MPESEDWPDSKPEPPRRGRPETDHRTGSAAAAARINRQHEWVNLQVQEAIKRGEFDDLPGAGKPIDDLGTDHDPDWWVKRLVERERIAVLPPSVQLRKDDAELDSLLDQQASEDEARRLLEEFNERVIAARYGTPQGPPLVTMPRDVDETLAAWRSRKEERHAAARAEAASEPKTRKKRWFRRT